jgi:hypothetical protein
VVRVPPKLMGQTRASAGTRDKSDPIGCVGGRAGGIAGTRFAVAFHDEVSRRGSWPAPRPCALSPGVVVFTTSTPTTETATTLADPNQRRARRT